MAYPRLRVIRRSHPRPRVIRNVLIGMAVSVFAGIATLWLWTLQSVSRLDNPLYAFPIPLIMGLAGSLWWRRQRRGGWGLGKIAIVETVGIAGAFILLVLPFGGLTEVTGVAMAMFLMLSPMIMSVICLGGWLGYLGLDRLDSMGARHDGGGHSA